MISPFASTTLNAYSLDHLFKWVFFVIEFTFMRSFDWLMIEIRAISIPDVNTSDLPADSCFSMTAGDFLEIYRDPGDVFRTLFPWSFSSFQSRGGIGTLTENQRELGLRGDGVFHRHGAQRHRLHWDDQQDPQTGRSVDQSWFVSSNDLRHNAK